MSELFENGQQGEEVHEQISLPGMPNLTVYSISRSERHTLRHTGWSCASEAKTLPSGYSQFM